MEKSKSCCSTEDNPWYLINDDNISKAIYAQKTLDQKNFFPRPRSSQAACADSAPKTVAARAHCQKPRQKRRHHRLDHWTCHPRHPHWLYHRVHGSLQLLLSHIEMKWCSKFTAQIIFSFISQDYRFWAIHYAGEQQDRCYIASPFYLPGPLGCSTCVAVHQVTVMSIMYTILFINTVIGGMLGDIIGTMLTAFWPPQFPEQSIMKALMEWT